MNILAVFIGGGFGAILRYLTGVLFCHLRFGLVPATFFVNVLASFILGFCFSFFAARANLSPIIRLALTAGFCGGLSTFSTFAFENLQMLETGHFMHFFVYSIASVIFCVVAAAVGVYLGKML